MNSGIKGFVLAVLCGTGLASQISPYAGQEHRAIKSMSDQEIASLLAGAGLGFARAAELNGYPGPMHVLELADHLVLSTEQHAATQLLMTQHKARARTLGEQLVNAERDLDNLFAARTADADTVDEATRRVALLQAQVRAEHLKTHIAQTALLSDKQVQLYGALRGYTSDSTLNTTHPPSSDHAHPRPR